jgi:putative Mg2+ transporter-C (MgtC) family protein
MSGWNELAAGVAADLGTLPAADALQLVVRLLVAGLVGAVLGWDRERLGKSAGLRTHVLVAVGSAAFLAVPQQAGYGPDAVARVLQGLVAGIGFLGAGCIVKSHSDDHVQGLTTAAGIWLTAGVGVAAGLGRIPAAVLVGALGWVALVYLRRWEHHPRPGTPAPTRDPV